MRTLSSTYLNAAKAAGRYPNIYAIIYGDNDTLTITGKDAIIAAHITRGDTAKPAYFETGRALSSSASITVDRRRIADESLIVSGAKVEIYAEFDTAAGAVIASEKLATMYISGYDDQNADIGYISAVDYMVYTGGDFNPDGLTYPISCSALLAEAFDQSGLSGVTISLPCDPNVNKAPYKNAEPVADGMSGDPYICRDIIAKIAGMQMSDIFIDADGAPKVYGYGSFVTTAAPDSLTLSRRVGAETFRIQTVVVYKTSERMAKSTTSYKKLPYGPRFEDMDDPTTGTWIDEIRARAHIFVQKDWTTATVTIAGVGELEPGDFVEIGTDAIPIFVSGIVYDFEDAHFTETLHSFAYSLEEYLQAPAKATQIKTDSTVNIKGGVGEEIGNHSVRFNEDTNTVTEDPRFYGYNILGGRNNSLTDSIKTIIGGAQNSGADVTECIISGEQNTVSRANKSIISGISNDVYDNDRGLVTGHDNTVSGGECGISCGSENTFTNCSDGVMAGYQNTANYASQSLGAGRQNTFSSNNSLGVGSNNTIDADNSITAGTGNRSLYDGLALGRYASYNSSNRIVLGNGSSSTPANVFRVTYEGNVYATAYNTSGADYAEYFEWADGNPDGEDRRGLLVQLIGDKIAPAHGDDILGAVSARPSVCGNAYEEHWHGKYKTDVFGAYIPDKDGRPQLSDDYDPEREYIPRSKRPEWAAVGMLGRLIICDNGKCEPGGYVTARQGVGAPTFKETRARCIRRLDGSHIEIIVR